MAVGVGGNRVAIEQAPLVAAVARRGAQQVFFLPIGFARERDAVQLLPRFEPVAHEATPRSPGDGGARGQGARRCLRIVEQRTPGDEAGVARSLLAQQRGAHAGAQAIRAHDQLGPKAAPIAGRHAGAAFRRGDCSDDGLEHDCSGTQFVQRLREHGVQVGAMHERVRDAVLLDRARAAHQSTGFRTGQRILGDLIGRQRQDGRQPIGQPQPVQRAQGIRTQREPRADLTEARGAFEHAHVPACAREAQRRGQAADARSDHDCSAARHGDAAQLQVIVTALVRR
jgi:hypothetical protein